MAKQGQAAVDAIDAANPGCHRQLRQRVRNCGRDGVRQIDQPLRQRTSGGKPSCCLEATEIVDQPRLAPRRSEKSDARGDPQIMTAPAAKVLRDQITLGEGRDAVAAARAPIA
jgi:hypothetical protein